MTKQLTVPHAEIKDFLKTRLRGTNGYPDFVLQFDMVEVAMMLKFMEDGAEKTQDYLDSAHLFNGYNAWPVFEGCCYALEVYTVEELCEMLLAIHAYHKGKDLKIEVWEPSVFHKLLTKVGLAKLEKKVET